MAKPTAIRHQDIQRNNLFQQSTHWSQVGNKLPSWYWLKEYKEPGKMTLLWNLRGLGVLLLQFSISWVSSWQTDKERKKSNKNIKCPFHQWFLLPFPYSSGNELRISCKHLPMCLGALLLHYLNLYPLPRDNELMLIDCMPMRTSSHLSANRQLCIISITCHYDAATVLQPFPVLWSAKINYPWLNY